MTGGGLTLFHGVFCLVLVLGTQFSSMAQTEDVLRPKGRPITKEERAKSTWEYHPERIPLAVMGEAGINVNVFRQDLQRTFPATITPNDVLSSGIGWGWTVGGGGEYQFRHDLAAQVRIALDHKAFANTVDGVVDYQDSTSEIPRDMAFRATTSSSLTYLSLTPSVRYSINARMFATVGVSLQARVSDVQRHDIIEITDADPEVGLGLDYRLQRGRFRSISRTVTANTDMLQPIEQRYPAKSTEFVQYHTWRTAVELGAGYVYPLDSRAAVVVQLRYQRMLSDMNDAFMVTDYSRSTSQRLTEITYRNARIHSVQLTIGLWFKLME